MNGNCETAVLTIPFVKWGSGGLGDWGGGVVGCWLCESINKSRASDGSCMCSCLTLSPIIIISSGDSICHGQMTYLHLLCGQKTMLHQQLLSDLDSRGIQSLRTSMSLLLSNWCSGSLVAQYSLRLQVSSLLSQLPLVFKS